MKSESPTLISINDVCRLTSLSRTYIHRLRFDGRFPQTVSIGDRRVAFVRSEILDWIEARIAERSTA